VSAALLAKWALGRDGSTSATPASQVQVTGERTPPGPPVLAGAEPAPPSSHVFDTVIKGGRVVDPDSGFDQVADVGIDGDRVASISSEALTGKATIDAAGLVVAPGFIDVLSYEPNPYGVWYKLGDGVTTNLGMHGIKNPPDAAKFFAAYEGANRPPVHYGGSFSDQWSRDAAGVKGAPTKDQLAKLEDRLHQGIADGFIGLAIDPEYAPTISFEEFTGLATVAQKLDMPLFSHIRYSSPEPADQSSLVAIDELLKVARETGVAVHVDHIPSMATFVMDEAIAKLDAARAEGLDVTGCAYPYDFWGTYLASARFNGDWQSRFRISYGDLQLAGSTERLTAQSFKKYQAQNKLVVAYAIPPDDVVKALKTPWVMVGSDAIPESSNNNHPRGAGNFSRLLGKYVREDQVLSLNDALAKITVLPARRLEKRVPMLTRKGRVQIGADADLTVFDPATVRDQSTVENPAQMSRGIEYVLVMGKVVKDRNGLNKDIKAGQPIKGQTA